MRARFISASVTFCVTSTSQRVTKYFWEFQVIDFERVTRNKPPETYIFKSTAAFYVAVEARAGFSSGSNFASRLLAVFSLTLGIIGSGGIEKRSMDRVALVSGAGG